MANDTYSRAYTEVLEILKCLPQNEYNKIATERIKFFEANKDPTYKFIINPNVLLDEQNISVEANSIAIILFRDYFATETQKKKLNDILKQNEYKENMKK